jgi:hypothetical protein
MELVQNSQGAHQIKVHETPLSNEAYVAQGTWRYVMNTNGQHYQLADLLRAGKRAKPLLRAGLTGFYASAAELKNPNANSQPIQIRSLSWPNPNSIKQQGIGELMLQTVSLNAQHQVVADTGPQYVCGNLSASEGRLFSMPMLSLDGTELSALPMTPANGVASTRVYKILADGKSCEKKEDLNFATPKAVFGFAQAQQQDANLQAQAPLVYENRGVIFYYDRDLKRAFNLADVARDVDPSGFPGITQEGRVIFGAHWQVCEGGAQKKCSKQAGYVVADPFQSHDMRAFKANQPELARNLKACITHDEVRTSRSAQAKFLGLE